MTLPPSPEPRCASETDGIQIVDILIMPFWRRRDTGSGIIIRENAVVVHFFSVI
jgi:hypothetical protein